jgi:hypothetical protein
LACPFVKGDVQAVGPAQSVKRLPKKRLDPAVDDSNTAAREKNPKRSHG